MKLKEENKKQKVILIVLGTLLTICLIIGISYAYWQITKQQSGLNKLTSGCFNLEMTNEKNDINLINTYPIEDSEGMNLTPFTFTITNTCNLFGSYTVNLEMLEGTTLASKYVKIMVNKEEIKNLNELETTNTVIKNSTESRKLASGSLGSGDSEDYTIRLWMDGDITLEDTDSMNKELLSKIVVTGSPSSYSPVGSGITLLKDAILANEYQTTDIEIAKSRIASKQSVDFSKTAPIIDWEESHSSSTSTYTTTLPDPSLVKTGILNTTNVLPLIGTGYIFNSETGYYTITNAKYVDPTTLNYDNQNYYFCGSGTVKADSTFSVWHDTTCTSMRKLLSATKSSETITTLNGTKYDAIVYKMPKYEYTQIEVESDKSDKGLYGINDANGTSYYYRGSVNNNYVYFGGFYWRIIRINGDGSIRLLYAGTKPNATGSDLLSTLTDSSLGFNNTRDIVFNTKKDNPAYVGYMYGNTLNSSYAETTANENDSNMKKYLDSWYRQNIESKGLSSYIADPGFCNDRSLSSGDGFSISVSRYGSYQKYNIKSPNLLCSNTNDLFTVNGAKGNGDLTYSIGLITVDELMLSGYVNGYINRLAYTYSKYAYWTMSPLNFANWDLSSNLYRLLPGGYLDYSYVINGNGVRPVINLKANTEITSGIGTSNQPFIIK